jgi:hypothetical protein
MYLSRFLQQVQFIINNFKKHCLCKESVKMRAYICATQATGCDHEQPKSKENTDILSGVVLDLHDGTSNISAMSLKPPKRDRCDAIYLAASGFDRKTNFKDAETA